MSLSFSLFLSFLSSVSLDHVVSLFLTQLTQSGNYDYDWDTRSAGTTPASVSSHAQTPREPAIEDIEERFRGLSTEACEGQSKSDVLFSHVKRRMAFSS